MRTMIIVLMMILSTIPVFGGIYGPENWYEVEPWELEFCQKWGGTATANSASTGSSDAALSQLTISMNAEWEDYTNMSNITYKLYKVSFYIHPIQYITEFAVRLYNTESGSSYTVQPKTNATPREPKSAYFARYLDNMSANTFDEIQMKYKNQQYDGVLKIPVVYENFTGGELIGANDSSGSGGGTGGSNQQSGPVLADGWEGWN